jgi:sugar phosphate permease
MKISGASDTADASKAAVAGGGISAMNGEPRRSSKKRWFVLFLICLMYFISYLDRVNISAAAPVISKEFGFDKITMGFIFSAFVWSYAIFQIPGGWLGDRFGPRRVLTALFAYWSITVAFLGTATGLSSLASIRFLTGIGEAGAFPTATRSMQLWFPRHERGLVQGVSHSASRFGAAVAPPIAVAIIMGFGWRWVFYISGGLGVLWSILWYFSYRNMPEEVPSVSRAELAYIRGVDEKGNIKPPQIGHVSSLPWGILFRSSNMWAIMFAYFTYVYCLWIFLSWLPSYLVEYRHFTLLKAGMFASMPLWGGVVGDTFGGVATDWLLIKTGRAKLAPRLVAVMGMLGCAMFIVPAAMTDSAYTAVFCLTGAMFCLECCIGPSWSVPMHVGGQYSGTVAGVMNMAGNIGGALSPIVFGVLVQYGSWQAPFIVAAALLVFGACVWAFWLDPEKSVIEA